MRRTSGIADAPRRLVALLLISLFFISPVGTAIAQTAASSTVVMEDSVTSASIPDAVESESSDKHEISLEISEEAKKRWLTPFL